MSKNALYVPKNAARSSLENMIQGSVLYPSGAIYVPTGDAGVTPWTAPKYSFESYSNCGMYFATDGTNYKNIGTAIDGNYVAHYGKNPTTGSHFWQVSNSNGTLMIATASTNGTTAGTVTLGNNIQWQKSGFYASIDPPSSLTGNITLTLPISSGEIATTSATQTFTNKTITSPTIGGSLNCGRATVTQTTSNTTAVTCNGVSGKITMATALTAGAAPTFTVNNTACTSSSIILVNVCQATLPIDGGVSFQAWAGEAASGSFKIQVYNNNTGSATRPCIVHFLLC